jgi:hypothetical protein
MRETIGAILSVLMARRSQTAVDAEPELPLPEPARETRRERTNGRQARPKAAE